MSLPAGFPPLVVPADNPLTAAKVELGRHLFFDPRLSLDGSMSCATCHQPARAFTDGRPRAVGVTGEIHPRASMTLTNVAYSAVLTWADPTLRRLEEQMLIPLFSREPVEMGLKGLESEVVSRLDRQPRYRMLFIAAFPDQDRPVAIDNIVLAIASFERTFISGESPYDRYVYWGETAGFSESARRGMRLFFSTMLGCSECHAGFNFSGPVAEPEFHNTGLYNLDATGAYPEGNRGLYEHTGKPEDMGRFRVPTLRNIALTAPYMHDGSLPDLKSVVAHYAAGGRTITAGPHTGVGRENPYKSPKVGGFEITEGEIVDLVSFLQTLTDERFINDPRFADPWLSP